MRYLIVTLMLLMAMSAANAAGQCQQSQIEGRWKMYFTTSTMHELPTRTILVLDKDGFLWESKFIKYADGAEFGVTSDAYVELQQWCMISGWVEIYLPSGLSYWLYLENGNLDSDRNTLMGSFYMVTNDGTWFGGGTFMATK